MKTSKFVQLDPKVLLEYIYDDSYLNNESYTITHDLNEDKRSYAAKDITGSNNKYSNQYVIIDPVTRKAGIRNSDRYNFLKDRDYTQNLPIRYDKVKLHFPINYNFDEVAGCYLNVYQIDFEDNKIVNLSQYFFDKQIQDRFNQELQLSSPSNTLNGRIWGKYIEIDFPSPSILAAQRTNDSPNPNSINSNLTGNIGLSINSPIMIDFGFINQKTVLNNITTFSLDTPRQISVPLTPDFENLGLMIQPSDGGDWFEIYGTFNNTISGFNNFINTAIRAGKRYFVEYDITVFEENIKGKTQTLKINDDFNIPVDFRPIIKYSTTTAAIEVIMRLIDQVDESIITRRASYGLLPDQVSKYSRSLTRISVDGLKTPKIYNLRNGGSIEDAISGLNRKTKDALGVTQEVIETIKVPYPLLVKVNNVVAKSEDGLVNGQEWKGFGKLKIIVDPFDNIFKFTLAKSVENKVEYLNLVNVGTIDLFFKNYDSEVKTTLYRKSNDVDLTNGTVVFKLNKEDVLDVRRIYQSGINMFYITSSNEETGETNVLYEGTFIMSDSINYVTDLAKDYQDENDNVEIRRDGGQETAIVTRRRIDNQNGA